MLKNIINLIWDSDEFNSVPSRPPRACRASAKSTLHAIYSIAYATNRTPKEVYLDIECKQTI